MIGTCKQCHTRPNLYSIDGYCERCSAENQLRANAARRGVTYDVELADALRDRRRGPILRALGIGSKEVSK